jgi:hypothetical protein
METYLVVLAGLTRAFQLLAETFVDSARFVRGDGSDPSIFIDNYRGIKPTSGDTFILYKKNAVQSIRTKDLSFESLKKWLLDAAISPLVRLLIDRI